MILHSTTKNVETNMTGAGAFTIKASAKAFKILSDGLYSDKIRAVIRELSCNGLDSHTGAGKSDIPIEVHLPNQLEQWFSVRDFGLGLSKDGIMNLYTTYFESTKNDSNDQIGALGLGSKSPFSYTDSFTVVSNYNGVKSTYAAYIGSNGEPAIQHLIDADTDECNGVEVKFPVKRTDINTFIDRASLVYRPFKVKPIITGNSEYRETKRGEVVYKSETGDWVIYASSYWNTKQYAVQGNIEYFIDKNVLNDVITDKSSFILNQSIDIEFGLGLLDISASRESLGYDSITKSNIITRLEEVYDDLCVSISVSIKNENTYYNAVLAAKKISNGIYNGALIVTDLEWNGKKLVDRFKLDSIRGNICRYSPTSKSSGVERYQFNVSFTPEEKYIYIYNDELKYQKGVTKARAYVKENNATVVLFEDLNFIDLIGDADYIKSTSLSDIKRNISPSASTGTHFKRYRHDQSDTWRFSSMFNTLQSIVGETDELIVYIPIKNRQATISDTYEYVELGKYVGLIDNNTKIVGVKESYISTKLFKEVEKSYNIISLSSLIEPKLKELKGNYMIKNLLSFISIKKTYDHTTYPFRRIVSQMTSKLDEIPVNSVMYKTINNINMASKMIETLGMNHSVMGLLSAGGATDVSNIACDIYNRYPMIELIDRGIYEEEVGRMIEYVNLVESSNS